MMTKNTTNSATKFARALSYSVAVAAIVSLMPNPSRAAPIGGIVTSGAANISASGLVTTINQTSDRAVIDWSSFNLSHNETARFVVPSDSSATLNRISGGVSTISGSVESNGTVYFANPNGLVFDATSRVSANGFVATTGSISNFDFMNRGEFSNHNLNQISLNGAISAPAITVQSGTVTVGGNLAAGSGKILLSSSTLTTIGQGAVISADCAAVPAGATGGNIKIWSDTHTDFLGTITARGGSTTGDGGFVEVSGKETLNFRGTVSTYAPHGKTGTLLLDPSDITISNGIHSATNNSGTISSTSASSIVNTTTLQAALGLNNVIIDATVGSGNGSGIIAVDTQILAATTGTNSLTLNGAQIVINANITMATGASLFLNANRGSVSQHPLFGITADTLSGTSVDGFALAGRNGISKLGTITNSGTAGILVKNTQALTINAGTIDGGRGGVMIVAGNNHITLAGAVTVLGSYLRIDAGTMNLKGTQTITALGLDVYYTSAKTNNSATIAVGSGSFTFVNDKRAEAGDLDLNSGANSGGWGTGLGTLTSGTAVGGLTVTTTGAASTINYQGLVRTGGVTISNFNTDSAQLRYIEGAGVGVIGSGVAANGALMLVSSGSGLGVVGGVLDCGISILTNFFSGTGGSVYGNNGSHITLIQTGLVSGDGIRIKQAYNGGGIQNLSVAGNLTITQFGRSNADGIFVENFALKAAGNIVATQVGAATVAGIRFKGASKAVAGGALSLLQSGISAVGIAMMDSAGLMILTANDGLLMRTMNTSLALQGTTTGTNILNIEATKTTIDLGRGTIASLDLNGTPHAAPGLRITALGSDLVLSSAVSANNASLTVTGGSFTYVNDRRAVIAATVLNSSSQASVWDTGFGSLTSGARSASGLTVVGSNINNQGVIFGGTVTIDGVTAASPAGSLRYIEGVGVAVLNNPSAFSGSLSLVGNGVGIASGQQITINAITIRAGLTVGAVNDGRSDLLLQQRVAVAETGIAVLAPVTVGRDLTIVAESSAGDSGISILSSLTAGRNLTLVKHGKFVNGPLGQAGITLGTGKYTAGGMVSLVQTAEIGADASGIVLINTSVAVSISAPQGISFKTANAKLTLRTAGVDVVANLTSPRVRIDLGKGTIGSNNISGDIAPPGHTMNALGADVYLTSATTGNSGTIAVGSGSFTFVNDRRSATSPVILNNMTTAATATVGWGTGLGTFALSSGSASLGGLTISTTGVAATINYQGVVYGGNVQIDAVTTGTAAGLRYIEGHGLSVKTASSFTGSLVLVSDGGEVTETVSAVSRTGTMVIAAGISAGISVGSSTSDGVSKLSFLVKSMTSNYGIFVGASEVVGGGELTILQSGFSELEGFYANLSTLKSGGGVTLIQSGTSRADGISLNSTRLTAAAGLSVIQAGTVTPTSNGILLSAIGTGTGTRAPMTAGSSSSWAVFKTNNRNLALSTADNFYLTSGILRLDLGSGVMVSTNPAAPFTLHAEGLAVYFTGATSGNSAILAIGSFTFVTDLRGDATTTVGNSPLSLASFSSGAASGLTVTGSSSTIKTGIVGTVLSINGLNSGANQGLSYIEGNSITVTGAASVFTGGIILRAVNNGSLSLGGNLSADGDLKLYASAMSLSSSVTTAGGDVTIDLGKAGVYNNGSGDGFTLTTTEQNLTITAGAITNTTPTNAIFRLGNGILTAGGGLTKAAQTRSYGTTTYTGGYITTKAQHDAFLSPNAVYYFATDDAAARTALATTANAVVLSATALTASDLGSQTVASYSDSFTGSGFTYRAVGDIFWVAPGGSYSTAVSTTNTYRLANGHAVHFYSLNNPTMPAAPPSWLAKSASLTFDGGNIFTTAVTLASAGAITQATGSTLTVSANGGLSITSSAEITLSNTNNRIGRLGALNSSGAITVGMDPANINTDILTLAGTITAGGEIAIRTRGGHLVLANSIITSGGNLTIDLAATGEWRTNGYSLTTSNRNLTFTATAVVAPDESTVFVLGSGTFSTPSTGLSATISGGAISYYDYDPTVANNKGTLIGSEDPNSTSKGWKFYGSYYIAALRATSTSVIWMNEASLVAGKVVREVGAINVTKAGLDLRSSTGTILYKAIKSPAAVTTDYDLATDHAMTLGAVGTSAAEPIRLTRVLSGSTIDFNGTNYFGGDLTLMTSGAITQQTGSRVFVSGKLSITGSSAVTLNQSDNGFNSLGTLTSNGQITIKSNSTVTVTGVMAATGVNGVNITADHGDIILSGAVSSNSGLNLSATAGSVTQAPGSTLTVTGGILQGQAADTISLDNSGNHIATIGFMDTGLTGGSITIRNDDLLSLSGSGSTDLRPGTGATFTLNSPAGIRLLSDITSSRGAVILNLGAGSYNSRNGSGSFVWSTTSQPLTLTAGDVDAGSGTVFDVGVAAHFTAHLPAQRNFVGNNIVVTNGSAVEQARFEAANPTVVNPQFFTVDEINGSLKVRTFTNSSGTVTYASVTSVPETTATVTFWNLRGASITRNLAVAGIRFAGVNSFKGAGFASHVPLTIAANGTYDGNLTPGAGGLTIEAGARVVGGTVSPPPHQDLRLNFVGDFVQTSGDSAFKSGGGSLFITSNGYSVRLLNRENTHGILYVTTGGGNFQMASKQFLSFHHLNTAGGWVVLDTTDLIAYAYFSGDDWLTAGSVSFRAGKYVELSGSFAAVSGTGASVVIRNSAAGSVIGGIRSATSVSVSGTGEVILAGDIVGSSMVSIATPVTVARDSTVATDGGRVEFTKTVAALNALVGLRLDAGFAGTIALGGSIGSPSLSLGWVELTGLISNPSGYGVYYTGGSLISTDRLRNWRNGTTP